MIKRMTTMLAAMLLAIGMLSLPALADSGTTTSDRNDVDDRRPDRDVREWRDWKDRRDRDRRARGRDAILIPPLRSEAACQAAFGPDAELTRTKDRIECRTTVVFDEDEQVERFRQRFRVGVLRGTLATTERITVDAGVFQTIERGVIQPFERKNLIFERDRTTTQEWTRCTFQRRDVDPRICEIVFG